MARAGSLPDLSGGFVPRAWDERILAVLAMNAAGTGRSEIAAGLNITAAAVAGMIDRIRQADIAESGEAEGWVARHYP